MSVFFGDIATATPQFFSLQRCFQKFQVRLKLSRKLYKIILSMSRVTKIFTPIIAAILNFFFRFFKKKIKIKTNSISSRTQKNNYENRSMDFFK